MRRPRLVRGAALLLLAAGACGRGDDAEIVVTPRVPVGTAIAAMDTVTEIVTLTGRLAPPPGGSALLAAPAAGVVKRIAVQVGSRVARGTLLVELDVPELEKEAQTLAAQAEIAGREAARQEELLREGITSKRQADEKAAEATSARSAARAAARLLERARVTSPLGGGVQRVLVHPGERVDAGAPLVEVIGGTTLDLLAAVPAAELRRIRVGAPARVRADGDSAGYAGRVAAVAPAVDSLTNAGQVVIRIPDPAGGREGAGGGLRSGAGATAIVSVGARHEALVIPDSALVVLGDSLTVFVVGADSVAHARTVAAGVRRGGRAEIVRGLSAGERVVTTGAFGLADGMRVVPSGSAPPSPSGSHSPAAARAPPAPRKP
ncbi:MAG TPA: efflux RND transporter periplasmic adaptor subunit [Gemmatimonadales bacterium]|jgi:RND family efflux transporter MFP subunit|nr:efflux RND transporter periplasmic adaptor subunit [Gemmatimonadales bacterium]